MSDKPKGPGGSASHWMGATGKFPHGKLNTEDEGELRFAIGERDDSVMLHFGTQVTWLAFSPEQAVSFAQLLIGKARIVARRQGKTLTVTL